MVWHYIICAMRIISSFFAVIFLALSGFLLVWASLPESRDERVQVFGPLQMRLDGGPGASPAVLERRTLRLEFPPVLRRGGEGLVRLSMNADEAGSLEAVLETAEGASQDISIIDVYKTHNVVAEARLEMAGVYLNPPGMISEPLRPGGLLTFTWGVHANSVGRYEGTVWFYLRFVPLDGGPGERVAISAQKVGFDSVDLWGLDRSAARWLGVFGLALGLGFVFGARRHGRGRAS